MVHQKLRILVLSDVGAAVSSNPFTVELVKSLWVGARVERVDYGSFWLRSERNDWDVVVLQWPELLVQHGDEKMLDRLKSWIERIKETAIIVTVVHNLQPHYNGGAFYKSLYDMIYQKSDGYIHLGSKSVTLQQELYPSVLSKPHLVVPHGNYECFGPPVEKNEARRALHLPTDGIVVLVFGEIRAREEFELALRAIGGGVDGRKTLFLAGRMPLRVRSGRFGRIATHGLAAVRFVGYFLKIMLRRNVVLHERAIPPSEVATYLCASDIVFIARKDALNSGNVSLGFTYGRIVVGPNIGNIGAELSAAGNPVYDPRDPTTIDCAMRQALDLLSSGVGEKNRELALSEWTWTVVAERLISFFEAVRTARN